MKNIPNVFKILTVVAILCLFCQCPIKVNALIKPGPYIGIGINYGSKIKISNQEGKFIEFNSKQTYEIPGNLEVRNFTTEAVFDESYMVTLNFERSFTIDKLSSNQYLEISIESNLDKDEGSFYQLKTSNVSKVIITEENREVTYTAYGNNMRVKFEGSAMKSDINTLAYSKSIQIFKISKNQAELFNVENQIKINSANTNHAFNLNSDYFKITNFNSKKQTATYFGGRKHKVIPHTPDSLKEIKITSVNKANYNFLTFNKVWKTTKNHKQIIGYRIYRKASGEKKYVKAKDLLQDENYYFDTTVTDGKKYSYKIKFLYYYLNPKEYFSYNFEIPENVWSKRKVFGKATELNARAIFNQTLSKFSNAKKIKIIKKPKPLYKNSKFSITAKVIGTKGKKLTSKKIKFISSNTKYLKINQKGKGRIIKKPKSGKIKVYLRAHNGLQKYITIKVK